VTAQPEVSVVLSTYNRAQVLPRALESLLDQDLAPARYEVVAVNNNSSDHTGQVITCFLGKARNVRYVFEPRQGLSHARNTGILVARAPIVAFTDDDVRVARNWLSTIIRLFADHPDVACVGGKVLPNWPGRWPAWLTPEHWAPLALVDYGDAPFYVNATRRLCLIGANSAYRREVFDRIGMFAPHVQAVGREVATEDHELLLRLWRAGDQGLYCPSLTVISDIAPDRMRRRYHRRWHRRHGRFSAVMRDEALERTRAGRLFGVPAHVYRSAIIDFSLWASALLHMRLHTAFTHETALWSDVGFLSARWREFFSPRREALLRELASIAPPDPLDDPPRPPSGPVRPSSAGQAVPMASSMSPPIACFTNLVSLKKMEQHVRAERSGDRKENAHGDRPSHPGAEAHRRRTRGAGTLGAPADDGAGVGAASARDLGVRERPHEHPRGARTASDQTDRRQVAESVCGRTARRIAR